MKILKKIGIVIVVLVVVYIILGFFGPSDYKVEKSIKIESTAETVFDKTSIFSNWAAWSPWAAADPEAIYTIEGDNQKAGATMGWNGEVSGKGQMTSTEVITNERFIYELSFIEPFEMTSHGGFLYEQEDDSILVTWYDEGDIAFIMRPMMLFMGIEDQIGPMFDQGLAAIKVICENMETESSIEITEEMVESKAMLYISESSSLMPGEISAKMGAAYGELMALMGLAKLEMASAPIAITRKYSIEDMTCEFDAALPIVDLPDELVLDGRIQKGETYAGKVLKTVHVGPYTTLKSTYDAMIAYIEKNGFEKNGYSWEEYIDDPTEVAPEELQTIIYFPIQY